MKSTILVIGAAGGVGLEVTHGLLAAGHRVLATTLNRAEERLVRSQAPKVSQIFHLDLGDASNVSAVLTPVVSGLKNLTAVVVCAAISPYGPLETTSLSVLKRALEINTVSSLAIFQACMPALRRTQGRLLFISSFAGRLALPFVGHYSASKFALEGLADSMRREVSKWGVKIILVEPGGIQTSMITNQTAMLKKDIASLDPPVKHLYGDLYERFYALNAGSYASAMPPAGVAKVILSALKARSPKARYAVGPLAKAMCAMGTTMTEAAQDRAIQKFYSA